ncbi:MAG: alpha-2-macroglobulin family protein [Chloroflexota bacterium]
MSPTTNPKTKLHCGILSGVVFSACCLVLAATGIFWFLRNQPPPPVKNGQNIPREGKTTPVTADTMPSTDSDQPIVFQLSEGQAQPAIYEPLPVADGEPLTPEEIQQIVARLPAIPTEAADQVDFKLPDDPIPPPRTGETIDEPFPPDEPALEPPETGAGGPLEVLRYSPDGEIPVAPFLSVTFNQPMVPLGTLQDLADAAVPVRIEPPLPGTWRWLGTKTLNFQYDSDLIDRLPKATEYRVTIPAGTQSMAGAALAEDVTWTFTTPAVKAVDTFPNDSAQPREPLFFVTFDQRIDPAAVLATMRVTAGGANVAVRLAEQAEVDADETVGRLAAQALEGRWIAFKAVEPLPLDSDVVVQIGPGTPSAEGPLVTAEVQSYSFRTYAPLKIEDHGCSWGDDVCRPLQPFYIRFNNPIDPDVYREDMLAIAPELPGASANIVGNTIQVYGASQGQTTYRVTIRSSIQDIFGQTLGEDRTVSFEVGKAEPVLVGPDETFVTLDPVAQKPSLSVYAINYDRLNVELYAVQPADWPAFQLYLRERGRSDNPPSLPGRRVLDTSIDTDAPDDKLTEVAVDLSEALTGGLGHVIVVIEPPVGLLNRDEAEWRRLYHWVQVTQIGLDAFADHSEMVAWATALKDGAPLPGVEIAAGAAGAATTTGADGVARFPIPSGAAYLTARQGNDVAMLPQSTYYWGDSTWATWTQADELRWFVYDDRQMYKPGEEVHVKGWMRRIGRGQLGDVGLVGGGMTVNYRITDSQGNDIGNGVAEVSALGGFDFVYTIPESVNLGYASIGLTASGAMSGEYYHGFQIQEFRRPEFEVAARNETTGPYFAGEYAVLAVDANYYAGGALPNAEVTWNVSSSDTNYNPPNWPGFTFGEWEPWWFWYSRAGGMGWEDGDGTTYETFTGVTDAAGTHYLRLDFSGGGNARPRSVLAQATVMDVNRQAWSGNTSLLVHPADLYVGLRSERYFVERGTPLPVDLIVTDVDGNAIAGRAVEVRAARMEWKFRDGQWQQEEADVQVCNVTSGAEPVSCTFETPLGGEYLIGATVFDDQGRRNYSQFTRWVSGGELVPAREVEKEQVTLIPDKETYQPGDVAEVLVQSPFSPAEGLLTVARSGILYTERFSLPEGSTTLRIPIEEAHLPNLNIQVDVVGSAARTDDQGNPLEGVENRPAYASGSMTLNISLAARTLGVQVSPAASELEPGGETVLALQVTDANGNPVSGAEVAVVVVDEAILALSGYQLADPLAVFYTQRPADVTSYYLRGSIVLANPLALAAEAQNRASVQQELYEYAADGAAPAAEAPLATMTLEKGMMDEALPPAGGGGDDVNPIRVRTDFNPLATFAPAVATDGSGQATVNVKLPDNLTRYRIMVVAVSPDGRQFGSAENNLTARLPLMVRPSAPRFLNFGDTFELPVVLQNQTDQDMTVDVAVDATNLTLLDAAEESNTVGKRVVVPARDRVEVRFPAAADMAGTARIQIGAVSGSYADAANVALPVYTPATTEAFATYGVLDEGAAFQPLLTPSGVAPQYGGLEITTSSTALQALTDAVLYLVSYPYDCAEQLSSRILAIAALKDVLAAFQADGLPSVEAMQASVVRDLETLKGIQNDDGGFPYWRRGHDSIPFHTIHAAHAMVRAQQMGFEIPGEMQQNALVYLRDIESHYPHWYSENTRWVLSSYALYVRMLSGDRDPQKALGLLNEAGLENLRLDAVGFLWPVIDDPAALEAIRTHVNNRAVETAGAANFITDFDEQNYLLLGSNRRTDAILLDALIGDNPQSDLIPKVVAGLLAHQTRGRWNNTQENIFVLLAMKRYFDTFEAQTPDFVARIWLGDTYAGEHEFRGYSTERSQLDIPMQYLVDAGPGSLQNLIVSKEGVGRLYYRLGLRYAPLDLNLPPADMGFVVERTYEGVDNPEDVTRGEDGVWHIKAGARVRVRLTLVADSRRYHVALVDPLPAGLEIVNPELAVSQGAPPDENFEPVPYYHWWWRWTWYEHQNFRDARAEAFTSLLWDGVYEYSYIARATTPGRFVAPPAKAEEMYSPEVFGRSANDWVVVE